MSAHASGAKRTLKKPVVAIVDGLLGIANTNANAAEKRTAIPANTIASGNDVPKTSQNVAFSTARKTTHPKVKPRLLRTAVCDSPFPSIESGTSSVLLGSAH